MAICASSRSYLLVLLRRGSDHPRNQGGRGGKMVRRERQTFRVEIIYGCRSPRRDGMMMGRRGILHGLRVDSYVTKPSSMMTVSAEISFGFRKQIVNAGHGLARARHPQQYEVLRRLIILRSRKVSTPIKFIVGAVVDGLGGLRWPVERAGDGQHVGLDNGMFGTGMLAMFVTSPCPTRPYVWKVNLSRRWCLKQVAFKILRRIHRVDGVLDCTRLGIKSVLGFIPNANDKKCFERDGLSLHQRMDFLLLFLHDGEQRDFFSLA